MTQNQQNEELEKRITIIEKRLDYIEKNSAYLNNQNSKEDDEDEIFNLKRIINEEEEEDYDDEPSKPNPVIEWLKKDFLMKVGAFLIILSVAWFVTYAFSHGWIGPMGQIAIGVLAGAGTMVFGHIVIPKKSSPGQVLVVTGGIITLLTLFAARTIYNFFTPESVLFMMSLVIIMMTVVAIVRDKKSMAITALFGGTIVPFLIGNPSNDHLILFSYIFIIDLAVIGLTFIKPWKEMIPLALIITGIITYAFDLPKDFSIYLLSYILVLNVGVIIVALKRLWTYLLPMIMGLTVLTYLVISPYTELYFIFFIYVFLLNTIYLITRYKNKLEYLEIMALIFVGILSYRMTELNDYTTWLFMGLFFLSFFIFNSVKTLNAKKTELADIILSGANGILLLIWIIAFVPKEWVSIILSISVGIFMIITNLISKKSNNKELIYSNSCLAILFLIFATYFEFSGASLTIAFQLEILLLILLSVYLLKQPKIAHYLAILNILPITLAINSFSKYSEIDYSIFGEHFFVIIIFIISLSITAYLLFKTKEKDLSIIPKAIATIGSVGLLFFIWSFNYKAIDSENIARGASLFIYTLIGLISFFYSTEDKYKYLRLMGSLLLGFVILRLMIVEVWLMSTMGRIGTFVAIGILLIASAFYKKQPAKNNKQIK